jgi:hypothetical protein
MLEGMPRGRIHKINGREGRMLFLRCLIVFKVEDLTSTALQISDIIQQTSNQ